MVNLLDPWGAKVPVLQPRGEFTISAGAVTLVGPGQYEIDTQSDAGSDNLDTINGTSQGNIVVLKAANGVRTVVLTHAVGNLRLAGTINCSLDSIADSITLYNSDGTNLDEISRSNINV